MKALKYLGFFLLICVCYLAVFAILIFTFDPPQKSQPVSPLTLFISLAAIGCPLLLTSKIIDNTYPGPSKSTIALVLLIILLCLTALHALGTQLYGGVGLMQLPFYAFNLCLIISLYTYKPQNEPKPIARACDSAEVNRNRQFGNGLLKLGSYITSIKWKLASSFAIITFILIITNPSLLAFKEHIGNYKDGVVSRESNFFVCSIFKFNTRRYIGIAENFFKLKPEEYHAQNAYSTSNSIKFDSSSDGIALFDTSSVVTEKTIRNRHPSQKQLDKELDEFIKNKKKH